MYSVTIVGTSLIEKIANSNVIIDELKNKILPEIGRVVQEKIQQRINTFQFKNGNGGNMARAVLVQINRDVLEAIIYNDKRIAPYAIYQERGVHATKMVWLKGKIIPFIIINGSFQFAGRNSRYYGDPKVKFVKVSEKSMADPSKWFNPGYLGRYFYRDGLRDAVIEIQKHLKMFTFRIVSGELTRGYQGKDWNRMW